MFTDNNRSQIITELKRENPGVVDMTCATQLYYFHRYRASVVDILSRGHPVVSCIIRVSDRRRVVAFALRSSPAAVHIDERQGHVLGARTFLCVSARLTVERGRP